MSEAIWFYVDALDRQVGPVTADEVRAALRSGATAGSNLAWRDGLPGWQPISSFAAELGLGPEPAPGAASPAAPPAPAAAPARAVANAGTPALARADDVVYAGFWRRLAAHMLDKIIIFVPLFAVLVALAVVMRMNSDSQAYAPLAYLCYFLIAPFYYAGMESSARQATWGKRALGIKVTDLDGGRISFRQALGRWFASALSYFVLYIGFIMAGFTERKRALHDFVASTQVVDEWAYTQFPERQQRSMSGCLIAFLVLFVASFLVVPILAAISISQYQDYVVRAQVSEGSALVDGVKVAVAEYVKHHNALPQSNADADLPPAAQISGAYVSYVDIGRHPGRIEIGYSSTSPQRADAALAGKHLFFDAAIEGGSISWSCHSEDLKQKFCPSSCSCSG